MVFNSDAQISKESACKLDDFSEKLSESNMRLLKYPARMLFTL